MKWGGPPKRPDKIGDFEILDDVGAGGMAVVYRARHADTGRIVALKTVRVPDEAMVRGIRREVRALARIRHPGIVEVVAEGLHSGLPWYAMELLSGHTLRAWSAGVDQPTNVIDGAMTEVDPLKAEGKVQKTNAQRAQPVRTILTVMRQLCDPLAFLHGEGIVHQDLKPENVFIRENGTPVLVDFGVVRSFTGRVSRDSIDPEMNESAGTINYMAPEQIEGLLVDARADLPRQRPLTVEVRPAYAAQHDRWW